MPGSNGQGFKALELLPSNGGYVANSSNRSSLSASLMVNESLFDNGMAPVHYIAWHCRLLIACSSSDASHTSRAALIIK